MSEQTILNFPAHYNDPHSSFRAAAMMQRTGIMESQRGKVVRLVAEHPGLTSKELAAATGADRFMLARRLPEAMRLGLIRREEPAHGDCRWWPAE